MCNPEKILFRNSLIANKAIRFIKYSKVYRYCQHLVLLASIGTTLLLSNISYAASCSGEALIDVTLSGSGGARWELCWELRDKEGVVITEVAYQPPSGTLRNVLKEGALAEINLAFDDGSPSQKHVTDLVNGGGLGINLQPLSPGDCSSGTLHQSNGINTVCSRVMPRNYAYKSYTQVQQGYVLEIESRAKIGSSSYIIRWRLFDDGTIQPKIGLAGEIPLIGSNAAYGWPLDSSNRIGIGFNTSYFWKLDFDLDSIGNNEVVEEFEVTPSANRLTKSLTVSTLSTESSRNTSPDLKRSWRIRDTSINNADGRAISYHLEPLHTAHEYTGSSTETWAQHDLHVTKYNACEQFVVNNPTTGGCGSDITSFVNSENINSADIVIWYKINYHHLPRSEDEPALQIHWDSFYIIPRDWTATNPLALLNDNHYFLSHTIAPSLTATRSAS